MDGFGDTRCRDDLGILLSELVLLLGKFWSSCLNIKWAALYLASVSHKVLATHRADRSRREEFGVEHLGVWCIVSPTCSNYLIKAQ